MGGIGPSLQGSNQDQHSNTNPRSSHGSSPTSHHVSNTNVVNSLERLEKPSVFFPVLKLYPFSCMSCRTLMTILCYLIVDY